MCAFSQLWCFLVYLTEMMYNEKEETERVLSQQLLCTAGQSLWAFASDCSNFIFINEFYKRMM